MPNTSPHISNLCYTLHLRPFTHHQEHVSLDFQDQKGKSKVPGPGALSCAGPILFSGCPCSLPKLNTLGGHQQICSLPSPVSHALIVYPLIFPNPTLSLHLKVTVSDAVWQKCVCVCMCVCVCVCVCVHACMWLVSVKTPGACVTELFCLQVVWYTNCMWTFKL